MAYTVNTYVLIALLVANITLLVGVMVGVLKYRNALDFIDKLGEISSQLNVNQIDTESLNNVVQGTSQAVDFVNAGFDVLSGIFGTFGDREGGTRTDGGPIPYGAE